MISLKEWVNNGVNHVALVVDGTVTVSDSVKNFVAKNLPGSTWLDLQHLTVVYSSTATIPHDAAANAVQSKIPSTPVLMLDEFYTYFCPTKKTHFICAKVKKGEFDWNYIQQIHNILKNIGMNHYTDYKPCIELWKIQDGPSADKIAETIEIINRSFKSLPVRLNGWIFERC